MFTGIIERVGKVIEINKHELRIDSGIDELFEGESISVNGVCVTVKETEGPIFNADMSEETLRRTNLASLRPGDGVNLERPLLAQARLGGHFVQGHVDAVGMVREVLPREGSVEMWFEIPQGLSGYLVEKGSVAVDGISLTVAAFSEGPKDGFMVSLVPFTLGNSTLGEKKPGDHVNIEVDILAKYVERLLSREEKS